MLVISPELFGVMRAKHLERVAVEGAGRLRGAAPAETARRSHDDLVKLWGDCNHAALNLGWQGVDLVDRLALIVLRAKGRPEALAQAALYAALTRDDSPAEVRLAFAERQLT